jgi:hypothetical protein
VNGTRGENGHSSHAGEPLTVDTDPAGGEERLEDEQRQWSDVRRIFEPTT